MFHCAFGDQLYFFHFNSLMIVIYLLSKEGNLRVRVSLSLNKIPNLDF